MRVLKVKTGNSLWCGNVNSRQEDLPILLNVQGRPWWEAATREPICEPARDHHHHKLDVLKECCFQQTNSMLCQHLQGCHKIQVNWTSVRPVEKLLATTSCLSLSEAARVQSCRTRATSLICPRIVVNMMRISLREMLIAAAIRVPSLVLLGWPP